MTSRKRTRDNGDSGGDRGLESPARYIRVVPVYPKGRTVGVTSYASSLSGAQGIILPLPATLGRRNLAECWWNECPLACQADRPESTPCRGICFPVRRRSHREVLSRDMIRISSSTGASASHSSHTTSTISRKSANRYKGGKRATVTAKNAHLVKWSCACGSNTSTRKSAAAALSEFAAATITDEQNDYTGSFVLCTKGRSRLQIGEFAETRETNSSNTWLQKEDKKRKQTDNIWMQFDVQPVSAANVSPNDEKKSWRKRKALPFGFVSSPPPKTNHHPRRLLFPSSASSSSSSSVVSEEEVSLSNSICRQEERPKHYLPKECSFRTMKPSSIPVAVTPHYARTSSRTRATKHGPRRLSPATLFVGKSKHTNSRPLEAEALAPAKSRNSQPSPLMGKQSSSSVGKESSSSLRALGLTKNCGTIRQRPGISVLRNARGSKDQG